MRFSLLARTWDLLVGSKTRRVARPQAAGLTVLPLEDRITPDGRPLPFPFTFVGTDSGSHPLVRAYHSDTGALAFERQPFETGFTGGVRVAAGDIDGDGIPDLIAAAGPGGGPRVVVYSGKTGALLESFYAYDPSFTGGVFVAAGDTNEDGHADIVTAAGAGGSPHVKVFSGRTGETLASFFAFDPDFRGGATVACADFTADGKADLVVGAGAGGGPNVRVFDLSTGQPLMPPLGSFYAFDPGFTGGVNVGTGFLTGDVTGDGHADIVAGQGPGGSLVRVFDGVSGKQVREIAPFGPGATMGVRVTTAFVNDDKYADVIVATGAGVTAQVKTFSGLTGAELAAPMSPLTPFGPAFAGGLFVAGSNDPATLVYVSSQFGAAVVGQTAAFQAAVIKQSGLPTPTGTVSFYTSGTRKFLGTTTVMTDPATGNGVAGIVIPASQYDGQDGGLGVTAQYNGDANYAAAGDFANYVSVGDGVLPGCEPCAAESSDGVGAVPAPSAKTAGGVGLDGAVRVARRPLSGQTGSAPDRVSDSIGTFGKATAGTNAPSPTTLSGAVAGDEVALYQVNSNGTAVALFDSGSPKVFFDKYAEYTSYPLPAATFHARNDAPYNLVEDTANAQLVVTDGGGTQFRFWDFSSGNGIKAGRLQSKTSPDGSSYSVTSWGTTGPAETQTTVGSGGSAVTESITYATASGTTTATLRRQVGSGAWATVRTAETADANAYGYSGSFGQLQTVKDASGTALETGYIRYQSSGYGSTGRVKYSFGAAAYARLTAALGTSVASLTDAQIAPYADQAYTYDSSGRVTAAVIAGEGCSACSGGQGTYTYAYSQVAGVERLTNVWVRKVVETLPDASTNTYYTDASNRLLLKAHADATGVWRWAYQYDATGRLVATAEPSALTGSSESLGDLVGWTGSTTYLNASTGLIRTTTYGTSTTATSSTAGDVTGYVKGTAIQQGTGGTPIKQSDTTYIARTAGGVTEYHVATSTQYRNDDGTGARTTTYSYTQLGSTAQVGSMTTTLPTVGSSQNGPGTAASSTTVFDALGRPIWTMDAAGVLGYTAYDDATGAVVKTIADVNTANTSDITALPSGWSTPSGAGLHLISTYEVDNLGRTTKSTDPLGHVSYTVYNDANDEVRTYAGWDSTTNTPTGPTSVSRDDRANGYTESLTMSATPAVSGGRPTGTESVSGIQSLTRSYRNLAGQTTTSDTYFDLTGVTYSTAANIGTLNTNYDRTTTDYGKQSGQANRRVSAAGTITRTEYDSLGRVSSTWVGTNDTPTTGFWSVTNTAGTNMVKVSEVEYDNGGVGDGNVTKTTQFPGGGAANRVSQTFYDWRNRAVASKSGVEVSESTSVNRPIRYTQYDNLGEAVSSELYDGDAVTVTSTGGVPNRPCSSLLRAKTVTSYDELGRAYKTETYSVDPSSGSVSSYALTSQVWFDLRGLTLKTSSPGGLVQKTAYDSLGRATTSYVTDGGGDSGWSDAGTVTGDTVLSQKEMTYDADGNVILSVSRERMHDATGTGALGTPSSGVTARVSYAASYYDLGNRTTASVNVGTNGGSSWTRPSSVPSRSDTVLVNEVQYDAAGRAWKSIDPKGIESRTYFDLMGRTTKTIQNYVDGTVSDADDKTVQYEYNAAGMTKLRAMLTGGGSQDTEYVYGVTQSGGSGIDSNDLVGATKWPDPSTGASSSGQQETTTVNALGQTVTATDRNGSVHTLTYDVLGRVISDAVTTLGSGVDGTVRRVETAYDSQGNAYLVTSYDAASGGSVVAQVQRVYDGLGQLIQEFQAHGGSVNTSTTPSVQYGYSTLDSNNRSRLTSMTYPNGRVITYDYGTGFNGTISRLEAIKDGSTTLEEYVYMGVGTVVARTHPQTGIDLTYIKRSGESNGDGGDQYIGLDRFGRVVDQRWVVASSGTAVDRLGYSYDRNGNRLTRSNSVNSAFGEVYTYDGLNQLASTNRGSGTRTQSFNYDAVGNWNSVTTNGTAQNRTANKQNEITSISGATTPTYDANGNMTGDETGKTLVYDAWNKLVAVKSGSTTLVSYQYDGLNRRIVENAGTARDLYYSANWQVLEEREGSTVKASYVWSPVYVDAMIARDRPDVGDRLYVIQDANFNVTALVNTSGVVIERYVYDAYGAVTVLDASWAVQSGGSNYAWVYLHQGTRRDGVSGLDYHRERDYSPTMGRWTSMDPMGYSAGDENLYRSLLGNPVNRLDPSGQVPVPKLTPEQQYLVDYYRYKSDIWRMQVYFNTLRWNWYYQFNVVFLQYAKMRENIQVKSAKEGKCSDYDKLLLVYYNIRIDLALQAQAVLSAHFSNATTEAKIKKIENDFSERLQSLKDRYETLSMKKQNQNPAGESLLPDPSDLRSRARANQIDDLWSDKGELPFDTIFPDDDWSLKKLCQSQHR